MTDKMFRVSPPAQKEYRVPAVGRSSRSDAVAKEALGRARKDRPTDAVHVVPRAQGWAVRTEGRDKASVVLETKARAIESARLQAKASGARLIEHGSDGRIQRNTKPVKSVKPSKVKG